MHQSVVHNFPNFPSYRSQAVQYGEPAGLPLADQPARHLPAFPVSQPVALPSAVAEPSPVFYSRASQCQSCSGPSQQHACQRLCSDYASARHTDQTPPRAGPGRIVALTHYFPLPTRAASGNCTMPYPATDRGPCEPTRARMRPQLTAHAAVLLTLLHAAGCRIIPLATGHVYLFIYLFDYRSTRQYQALLPCRWPFTNSVTSQM